VVGAIKLNGTRESDNPPISMEYFKRDIRCKNPIIRKLGRMIMYVIVRNDYVIIMYLIL